MVSGRERIEKKTEKISERDLDKKIKYIIIYIKINKFI